MFTDWEKVIQVEAVKKSLRARALESAIFDSYIFQEPWENCLYVLRLSFPICKIIVQLLSHVQLFDSMGCSTPGFSVLSFEQSLLKLTSIESEMPSNHLILCCPLFLLPPIFPSIRVFFNEAFLHIG